MHRAWLLATPILMTAAPAANRTDAQVGCQRMEEGLHAAVATPAQAGAHRLDQLPPANDYLAVLHIEGGCVKPQVVSYDNGRSERR